LPSKLHQRGELIHPRHALCVGHNLGTAEVEAALTEHPAVAEAAVVGVPHDVKGERRARDVCVCVYMQVSEQSKAVG